MRFVLRRLGFFVLTLWAALTLNFFLPRMMPGNPALAILGKFKGGVSPQALKALDVEFGGGHTRACCPANASHIWGTWRQAISVSH